MFGFAAIEPRTGLHPLVALGLAVAGLSLGLAIRPFPLLTAYVISLIVLVLALGYGRPWLVVHKFILPLGLGVGLLTWLINGSLISGALVLQRFLLFGLTTSLVAAIDPHDLARALGQARCPRNVSLGFLVTVRFIPVLKSEMERLIEAARVRGLRLSWRNFKQNYRVVMLPLVVRLLNISDTLALSLETRGFSAKGAPTAYRRIRLTWRDWLALPGAALIMGGACWWMAR